MKNTSRSSIKGLQLSCVGMAVLLICATANLARASILEVGPGMRYTTIEQAVNSARPGDVVRVHPLPGNAAYRRVALIIHTPNLVIGGIRGPNGERIKLDGTGFTYAGQKNVSRAIFQFNAGSDGCSIEGFELCNARNGSNNGAGVRVNTANDIVVRDCEIDHNDNGIMSNGEASQGTGRLRVENCFIHHNGALHDPGFSHNLYVGGTSVILHGCEVADSVGGHNIKSRAHYTRVEYCYVHDAAGRELDLVDEKGNTTLPNSDAVILGCLIVKRESGAGNHNVIHFGQDGHNAHNGTLYLIQNTIITFSGGEVLELSDAGVHAAVEGNLIWSANPGRQFAALRDGAQPGNIMATANWISPGWNWPAGADVHGEFQSRIVRFDEQIKHTGRGGSEFSTYFGSFQCVPLSKVKIPTAPGESRGLGALQEYCVKSGNQSGVVKSNADMSEIHKTDAGKSDTGKADAAKSQTGTIEMDKATETSIRQAQPRPDADKPCVGAMSLKN